jgi:hypothetical protein
MARRPDSARILAFPDLKPATRRELMGQEIGTQFDFGQRLFAYYGEGDVFDYGEWSSRDMKTMFARDGICSALEQALTLPIRGAPMIIQPAKNDNGEAEFVSSVLMTPDQEGGMRTSITDFIGQVTSAQVYRRAFFEKVWKIRESDGMIVYDKLAYRPPATCQARYNDRTGEPNGFRQQVWLFGGNLMLTKNQKVPGYVDIPKIRSYIYTHGKYREPLTGVSEMEVSYWCYQTKMKLLYLWYHYLENMALQRVITYGNDQGEADNRADAMSQLKGSGVVGFVHPEQGQKAFETLDTPDAGTFFAAAMTFLETWQTASVMAGFLQLTGAAARGERSGGSSSGGGSYGMSQDASSYFSQSRQTIATEIAASVSNDIIRPLVVVNFGPDAAFPTWKFGPLQDESAQSLITLFGTLAAAPALNIPVQVLDLITERMATILDLDVDQVKQVLSSTVQQRAEKLAGQPPPGMPPEAAGSLGQLQGLAQGAGQLQQMAAARSAATRPPAQGQLGVPAPVNPAGGPPRAPSQPPRVPPPGGM